MIELNKVTKAYGAQVVLDHTSFTFPSTGLVCLLGPSGCGKSTLLHLLAGFDSDYSGEIIVHGTAIQTMSADELCSYRRNNIGFVFQDYNLLKGYTVLENVLLPYELHDGSTLENIDKARELLKQVQMLEKENQKIENLSGGEKQRVAIVRALLQDPTILLADEPTGSLDRKNATGIMELLKVISKEHLVLIITHDKKICEFADIIVSIKDGKLISDKAINPVDLKSKLKKSECSKDTSFHRSLKNFKVHILRYLAVSFAISIGIFAFMLSLSSTNVLEKSIVDFKEKNTAFNNGYVKNDNHLDEVATLLKNDHRVNDVYQQYKLENITLTLDGKSETMTEKYPMPKATESMSYGRMPKVNEKTISLSPSLAKKFQNDIDNLIGKELVMTYDEKKYQLTISGIFNAGYDDFFISSDIEQELYQKSNEESPYSLSYDVNDFKDVISINQILDEKGIVAQSAVKEVEALQRTFENLNRLFIIVSILILSIGVFISVILLVKLTNSRYREVGLLSALGFSKKQIRNMILYENILLSGIATLLNATFLGLLYLSSSIVKFGIVITLPQLLFSMLGTAFIIIVISVVSTHKLIHIDPVVALRM